MSGKKYKYMNILTFYAHPDDETMLAGGTLALLARLGATVHYMAATRGEGGENGEPPVCSLEELGQVREQEMICAVRALGGSEVTFMDYTDPRVGPDNALFAYTEDLPAVVSLLKETITRLKIDALFTHGSNGEYGHPAHLFTHRAARRAVEELGAAGPLLYSTHAAFPEHPRPRLMNRDDPADLIVDITPVLEQKTAAALCHRTQHNLFVRNASKEAGRLMTVPEVIQRVESLHRHLPPVDGKLDDDIANLLLNSGQARRAR